VRRLIGLALAGVGAFLIVIAIVLPTYITSHVIEFPLNEYETITLTASDASYFSPVKLTEITGANLRATYTFKGDAAAGDGSTAVWDEFAYIYDTTDNLPVQPMARTFAFDRKTAELVQCCGENVNGQTVIQEGIVGYAFPIGTKKHTYQVFDTTLDRPVPFTYAGTATVDGVASYKFVNVVAPAKVGYTPLSASEPEYYSMHLEYWVDPQTGALLRVSEDEDEYLAKAGSGASAPAGTTPRPAVTLLNADLSTTPATVGSLVRLDHSGRARVRLLRVDLPRVLAIVGALALLAGVILARRPRAQDPGAPDGSAFSGTATTGDAPDAATAGAEGTDQY
jgi:Porin PorA